MAIAELEGIEEDEEERDNSSSLQIDPLELEKILKKLGTKCCNRTFVEEMEAREEFRLPGILRGYCRYCLGYRPLGECKGSGYNNPRMQEIETLRDIDRIRRDDVCF